MFNNMVGKYYPFSSTIHKMNALSKFICIILFLLILFITNNLMVLLYLSLITIIMILLSNVPLFLYLKTISSLKVLIFFIIIINFLFNISFITSLIMILKIILGVLYSMIFIFTTTFKEITGNLESLLSPFKIFKLPIKQMALSLSLALKFIPLIFNQAEKILKSQASRGIDFKHSNLKGKVLAISSMLLPMFILSLKRADDIVDCLEVRSYDINKKNKINKWHLFDKIMLLVHLLLLIIIYWKG